MRFSRGRPECTAYGAGAFATVATLAAYLVSGFDSLDSVWVDGKVLGEMWSLNSAYYLPVSHCESKDEWFSHRDSSDDRYGIIVPLVSLKTVSQRESVSTTNGRHRTRWLLDCGLRQIVVAMASGYITSAMRFGFLTRVCTDGDRMSLDDGKD